MSAAKSLVLCADDYAADEGVTRGVLALARRGRLTATSAMVLSPRWREDAAPLREWRAQCDVGLHLDFTSDFARAQGHGLPLGAAMRRALLGGFDQAAAREVIERQLDAFEAAWGAPPDHVDGHQHVQQFNGIRQPLVAALARRYGPRAPWLRVSRGAPGQHGLKTRVIAWLGADAIEKIAACACLASAEWLSGIYDFSGGEAVYAERMARWLAAAPSGTVLMCHPADPAAGSQDNDPIAAARHWEFNHLSGPGFAAQCAAAGVHLVKGSALYVANS
ncbi:ChbG/HpnK family deacetylase [Ottowia testudinis]|uniref:ChbG/HpnK family deacetylase n=1 Tax=Ottowia testudinis TaxID=2816950 RepID=A0A975H413_9BURK|nr:ChbG/HpnK family deacetylase [Ottowia testudinis]QTD45841.1 ChbG/HpnK family deacetylase [Ottowia testudinis]